MSNDKPTSRTLLEETHDTVIRLSTILLGIPGTDETGLVGEVKQIKTDVNGVYSKHRKLSLRVWILVAFFVGSGIISIGEVTNLFSLFGG